jgi:undecaprenyl-diphosphatase
VWAADAGLVVGGILAALWVIVAAVVVTGRRRTNAHLDRRGLVTPALAASGAAVALVAVHVAVADAVEDGSAISTLDAPAHSWFLNHRTGALNALMELVSAAGGTAGMAVLATIGAALLLRAGRWLHAVIVVLAMAGAELLGNGFKVLYARARPPVADQLVVTASYALPSGHSLGSVVVLGVLAAVGVLLVSGRARRACIAGSAVVAVLLIGVSRLYLGVHWVTDVLSGYLLVIERRRADEPAPKLAAA